MLSSDVGTYIGTVQVIDCGIRLRVFVELRHFHALKQNWSPVIFSWVLMMAGRSVVASVGFSSATRDSRKHNKALSFVDKSGERTGHAIVPRNVSLSRARVVRAVCDGPQLEDSVSTAERLRPRIVVRAKHVLVALCIHLRLRRDGARREHVANTVQATAQASCDHDRGALSSCKGSTTGLQGEECPWRGRPALKGMCCDKGGTKQGRRINATSRFGIGVSRQGQSQL